VRDRAALADAARAGSVTRAVAAAACRSSVRHLEDARGSRRRLILALTAVAAMLLIGELVIAGQLHAAVGELLRAATGLSSSQHEHVVGVFVASAVTTSAAFALLLVMVIPPHSRIALAAVVAGAPRSAVAVGEFVPTAVAVLVVTALVGAAPILAVAASQPAPAATALALVFASAAFAFLVLAVRGAVIAALQSARVADVPARAVGSLVSVTGFGLLLADLLAAATAGRPSVAVQAFALLWRGRSIPDSWLDVVGGAAACLVALASAVGATALGGGAQPLTVGARLIPLRTDHGGGFWSAALREAMLHLRHPVTTISLATLLVLIAATAVGVRAGVLPAPAAAVLCALLCASGAETAPGRTRAWGWVRTVAAESVATRVLAQLCGVAVVQGLVLVVALVAVVPADQLASVVPPALPLFAVLMVLAYLAGAVLPYSEHAPVGAAATTGLVLAAELGWLFADGGVGLLGEPASWLRPVLQAGVTLGGVLASIALVRRDESRLWGA
jgi:hypothetical protein